MRGIAQRQKAIKDLYDTKQLTLQQIAEDQGVTLGYVQHVLAEVRGSKKRGYRRSFRSERGKRLLKPKEGS